MSAWIEGRDYVQVQGSWLGPFHGRVYSTVRPLAVMVAGLEWPHANAHRIVKGCVNVSKDGSLYIAPGYQYDGPSGPTWDDRTNMRGSCAHDALYYMLRAGLLGRCGSPRWERNRLAADRLLGAMMVDDGAWRWRAAYYVWAVQTFAACAALG